MSDEILDLEMVTNDADAKTIREYLKRLLSKVITEEEGFDGKRPFGNSGWLGELGYTLAMNDIIARRIRTFDYEGDRLVQYEYDNRDARQLILEAINRL